MASRPYKIFLASSSELEKDRQALESYINRRNKAWHEKGVFLELVVWEDFLDVMSRTRLQDEYNQAIRECDLFVMLYFTKVGPFTEEEFDTAFKQFQATNKPFILTYFKDAADTLMGAVNEDDQLSLLTFKKKLRTLGHYQTVYKNIEGLQLHFGAQLDKLAADRFIKFHPEETAMSLKNSVVIGGDNHAPINLGTQINSGGAAVVFGNVNTGGGAFIGRDKIHYGLAAADLQTLFTPLFASAAQAPAEIQKAVQEHMEALQQEIAQGAKPDDSRLARIVDGLADLIPEAVSNLVSAFASPLLNGIVGPATRYVLDKLQGK